jgi:Mrp family chromosome partitioning ATPase/capsular polysaccharide biosynthesis protein
MERNFRTDLRAKGPGYSVSSRADRLIEPSNIDSQTADWQLPGEEQQGIRRYVQTIRERSKLIALSVLVTTLAAALYVGTAQKTYKAEADLIITPIAGADTTLNSIPGLIRESSDPTRNVQTAARLVTTTDVARLAKAKLNTSRSAQSLLNDVEANPVAGSDLVAITATGSTADSAQNLANVFADAVVADRTAKFHDQVDVRIKALKTQVASLSSSATLTAAVDPLRTQLSELETVRAGDDPTVKVDTPADKPTSPAWPKRNLSIVAGIIAGLALGIGGAFAAQVFDPRLRREEQLRALFRLPILARIPVESRAKSEGAIAPHQLSPAGVEAYRTLRATLTAPRGKEDVSRAVMITGASPSEGKTTTALNLAASLALAGKRVILIEADLRRPKVGKALGVTATRGIASVLIDGLPLSESLLASEAYGENLKLLLVDRAGEWMADQFSLPAARGLVDEAKELADYVIIDSPPLAEVIDALPLVQMTDDVVIVVRLGRTHINKLQRLGEILAQYRIRPAGFAVVGVSPTTEYGYYTDRPVRVSDERRPVLSR